jgi:hypothetical protein
MKWLVQGNISEHVAASAIDNLMRLEHKLNFMSMAMLPIRPFDFVRTILQSGAGQRHSLHGLELKSIESL